jgi:hypothetical protein
MAARGARTAGRPDAARRRASGLCRGRSGCAGQPGGLPGGLANYYRNNVIGGAGAFVAVAENFNSFDNAIIKKLIAEIAQAEPQQQCRRRCSLAPTR